MTCGSPTPLHALPLPCRPRPGALQSARWRGTGPVVLPRGTGRCPSRLREGPELSPSVTTRSCCSCPCAHSPASGQSDPSRGPSAPRTARASSDRLVFRRISLPRLVETVTAREGPPLPQQPRLPLWEVGCRDRRRAGGPVPGLRASCRHAGTQSPDVAFNRCPGRCPQDWGRRGQTAREAPGGGRVPGARLVGESRLTERQAGSPVLPICSLKGEGFAVVRRSGRTDGDKARLASQVWWLGASRWKDLTRRDRTDHFT